MLGYAAHSLDMAEAFNGRRPEAGSCGRSTNNLGSLKGEEYLE
jgi:hypothetical protein